MSLYISKPRTPKHRWRPKSGPQYQGAVSAVHLKRTPGARLGSPPFRPSRFRSASSSSLISPMHEVTRASRTWGPQQRRESLGPSDLEDAWCPIEPSRRFAHRNYDKQGSTPSYSRTPKAPMEIKAGSRSVVIWETKELSKRGQKR
jgi:hypothetical protein